MRLSRAVSAAFVLLLLFVSLNFWAQTLYHFEQPILARLSFNSSPQDELPTNICLAVSKDGHYRMLRPGEFGREMLEGTMSERQMQRLTALLDNPEFQKIEDYSGGGIIRNRWQSFGAEVFRNNRRQRVQWLDAEDTRPFPPSIHRLIDWLLDFEPVHSKSLSNTEYLDVCPSGGIRPAQPLARR